MENMHYELRPNQNQLQTFVKYLPGAIAMFDKDMNYILANDGWYENFELNEKNIIGRSHYEVIPEIKEITRWVEDHKKALAGEVVKSSFDSFIQNGTVKYLKREVKPWYTTNNEIGGIMLSTEIINDEVVSRLKLETSERRFSNIFNKAMFGMALMNPDKTPFLVNQQLCDFLEYPEDDITSRSIEEITHPKDVNIDTKLYHQLLNNEIDSYTIEKRFISSSGSTKYAKINYTLLEDGIENLRYALAIIEDITDRKKSKLREKKAKEEVNQLNEILDKTFEIARIGTWQLDTSTGRCTWSDMVYDIYQLMRGTEIDIDDVIKFYHDDHKKYIIEAIDNALIHHVPWDVELKITTTAKREKWVRAIGKPIVESNKIIKLQGLIQDIDIKKRLEMRLIDSEKELTKKVEFRTKALKTANDELEAFSYSVSHDLRAPLRAINGFSKALAEDYSHQLDDTGRRYLDRINTNSHKMGELIDDLLEFSRMSRKQTQYQIIDLNTLVDRIVSELFPEYRDTIFLEKLPEIVGDKEMLNQVFSNILSNAIKYSSKEATPEVRIECDELRDYFVISIGDNGVGFNMDYADKLFKVFQRLHTDQEFEGTGVGLSLCHKIMSAHGGEIWAKSELGKGATFFLKFLKEL